MKYFFEHFTYEKHHETKLLGINVYILKSATNIDAD